VGRCFMKSDATHPTVSSDLATSGRMEHAASISLALVRAVVIAVALIMAEEGGVIIFDLRQQHAHDR